MLPETLRLADSGLGHDDRAKERQPVASRLGPRFYDWQLTQTLEESWRECHLHARNLLGGAGFEGLLSARWSLTGMDPRAQVRRWARGGSSNRRCPELLENHGPEETWT